MIPPLWQSFARLFILQGSFNYERMLGLGVGYALLPMIRALRAARGDAWGRQATARAAGYFNAHPYLAGLLVGAQARAESEGVPGEAIDRLRHVLTGPLGSYGDRMVWAGWLPATMGVALVLVGLGVGAVAPLVFLLTYNALHVGLRLWGLYSGWRLGMGVPGALAHPLLRGAMEYAPAGAVFAVGAALPLVAHWVLMTVDPGDWWGLGAVAAAGLVVLRWLAPRLGGLRLAIVVLGLLLVVDALWPT